ncbi:hypothetical protein JDFR1000234_20 [uncultured archaeal virus]|uniref:Uncharacterized protein n=1 Tax=uncultured archaeal virus TaxID=1960247 RepID=A0A1S5Y2Z6_9VIRU|nr:hypothetical protein JDFR1000234_20 [uncultured archaeal virus]
MSKLKCPNGCGDLKKHYHLVFELPAPIEVWRCEKCGYMMRAAIDLSEEK